MRCLFACLALLATFGLLSADPPVRIRTVLGTQFLPAGSYGTKTVPGYGVGYDRGPSDKAIEKLTLAIEKLNATLAGRPDLAAPGAPGKITDSSIKVTRLLNERCATCHDKETAAKNAKGLILFEKGKLLPLSKGLERDLVMAIWHETMPKEGKKLSDVEISEVIEYLYLRGKTKLKKEVLP